MNDMRLMFLVAISSGVLVMTGCGKGEDLKTLSSAEIEILLKGNTVTMESAFIAQSRPFKQYFGANGITVQATENKRTGKWHVDNSNNFCILWDMSQKPVKMAKETAAQGADNTEACFQVKQDSQGKFKVYSATLGYVGTLGKIVSGNPGKPK